MGNRDRGIFSALESYVDMLINLIAFFVGYIFVIFFEEPMVDIFHPVTIAVIFANLLVSSLVYHTMNLYRHSRYSKPYRSIPEVIKVNAVYFGALTAISAFLTRPSYKQFILFWILFSAIASTAFLSFKRHMIKFVLSVLRTHQYHLRKVIIIGDNTAAAVDYVKEVASNSQYGMVIVGYVGDKIAPEDISIEKLGAFKDLAKILDKYRPTDVVFAIDAYDKRHLIRLVNMCDDRCIKVYFLPVIYGFFKNSRQIEQIGSVPLINVHSTPLDNYANAFIKRTFDIIGSILLIILASPIMIAAAIGVRISSPGPIFFKQKRVGRMGKCFTMLKFRSMRVNADSNKAWTTGTDPRKTKFGTFLRRTAIDELPQLFNVLVGSMSLVGPRPEIPVFVEHFKEIVPLYMIKHYVKPGITGLAQIKGFRGDTSIEARIHEDIAYIENWSLALDLYVLFKTPFKAINKNEKFVSSGQSEEPSDEEKLEASLKKDTEAQNKDTEAQNNEKEETNE
jgi:Undecaprenyl-phosphate glucose phosphotransferase